MAAPECQYKIEYVTDPVEVADFRRSMAAFDINLAWWQPHASEVYSHRGKYYCIAGQELFIGDDVIEVVARAKVAHPDDEGYFTGIVPKERGPRIYAR
jgi:hypothetical protein